MTSTAQAKPARRRRGMLDGLLMIVLVYAVYAKTPLGAIGETAVNVARGQKERPSWLATFKGRETAVAVPEDTVKNATAAESVVPAPIAVAAEKNKVDPEAVAALVSTHGSCTETACEMEAPPRASAVLASLAGKTKLDADEAAQMLAAGQKDLEGNAELAIEAMWVGPIPTKLAVEQARRSNSNDAVDVEQHADFLSPSARRGPLQGALAVLAVYRLRTLAWPADKRFRVTSPFGERVHPVTGGKDFHNGTDLGVPTGTPLWAAAKGKVKRQSQDSISGNYVILDHGLGIQTTYCHMSEPQVVEGAPVTRKQVIGLSGGTGRVTGPHLHYILRVRDKPVDAQKYGESPTRGKALVIEVPPPPPEKPAAPVKPVKPLKPAKATTTAKSDAGPVEPPPATPTTPATTPTTTPATTPTTTTPAPPPTTTPPTPASSAVDAGT